MALTDARLLFVEREALFALCRRRPDVALGIIAVLARRLRRFAALIEDLALRDVPDPYYRDAAAFEEVLDLTTAASRGLLAALQEGA